MKEYIFNLFYVTLVGVGLPIMRFMSVRFDVLNNNAIRFLSTTIFLLVIIFFKKIEDYKKIFETPKYLLKFLFLAILMLNNTFFLISGISKTSSLTASVFLVLSMPLGTIVASIFYKDEREILKNFYFLIGSFIAIMGSLIFIFFRNTSTFGKFYLIGSLYLFFAILIQAFQSLLIKNLAKNFSTITITVMTSTIVGVIYLLLAFKSGVIFDLKLVKFSLILCLALSGIYGIMTGMFMAFYIIKKQGVAIFNLLQLLLPITTSITGFLFLNEVINSRQFLGMILIISGCFLAMKKKKENL